MKLAELLIERAEIQRRIAQLSSRLNCFATVQEGAEPPIKPDVMLKSVDELHVELEEIIKKINHANSNVYLENEISLADAIIARDILKSRRNVYDNLSKAGQIQDQRYSKKEIRMVSTIDVENIIHVTDELSKNIRLIDSKIQAKNWEVEV